MTTQKIHNKRNILLYAQLMIGFIFCNVFIISILSLLEIEISKNLFILIILGFFGTFCIQCILLLKLKYFEYDNSGEVIIVKNCNFWAIRKFAPPLEFPKKQLLDFDIHQSILMTRMELKIKSERRGEVRIIFHFLGFTKENLNLMKRSLQMTKENNYSDNIY